MNEVNRYYKNTKNALPHQIIKKFVEMNIEPKNAIDLGCGAGRDTIYLIKNGWNVLAIDREDTRNIISKNLNDEEKEKLRFEVQNFENIKLEKNNLIVSNFGIPFCKKDYFIELWEKITKSILKDGYFVGNFFGLNDSWLKTKKQITFLSKEQILNLFLKSFDIKFFDELEKDSKTALGKIKHWHIYNVIAKKK